MIRAVRPAACLLFVLAAACGPKPRPTTMADLTPNDISVCTKAANTGNSNLHGEGTLLWYVDADGAVPAAWFHDSGGLDSPQLFRCLTSTSVELMHEKSPVDHIFGWVIACEASEKGIVSCEHRPLNKLPEKPVDESVAQATLTFSDWADNDDKGWGYYYVHKYSDAQAVFQTEVGAHPDDYRAWRGLAQSLLENGGDVKKAREAADKAVSLKKDAASLEALVRVCLKQGDDECTFKAFQEAVHDDASIKYRTLDIATLNEPVKAVAQKLQAADEAKAAAEAKVHADAEAKAKAEDPCYGQTGVEADKCAVKHCFGEGARSYAAELKKLTGANYEVGEITGDTKGDKTTVTIAIRPEAKKSKKKADPQDATWEFIADGMKATTLSANNIATKYNACAKK